MKILITGISGFLGSNIAYYGRDSHEISGIYHSDFPFIREVDLYQGDLLDFRFVEDVVNLIQPDAIIHNAALANPDACEKNPRLAELLNLEISQRLARLCRKDNIRYLFTSTDLVFNGENPPYAEDDVPAPLGVYARTKAKAEKAILDVNQDAVVVRVSLMFGRGKAGLVHQSEWLERELRKRFADGCGNPLPLFTDQYRTMISVDDAAKALIRLCRIKFSGIINMGGLERISRYDFGKLLVKHLGIPTECISPASLKENSPRAPRPADVSLRCEKAQALLGEYTLPVEKAIVDAY